MQAELQAAIQQAGTAGRQPLVIFDIDDTIIDCRHRKLQVFRDFLDNTRHHHTFPMECQELSRIQVHHVHFRVSECLAGLGILNPEFEKVLTSFWRQNYFTHPYLLLDQPFTGAEAFVNQCLHWGAHIIYLTGRDEPGMGEGTRIRLTELGFPYPHPQAQLIMKPQPDQPDLDFKQEALARIEQLGSVIATFENELRNLNMMAEVFPDALLYHRQTLQSPNQPAPHPKIKSHFHF